MMRLCCCLLVVGLAIGVLGCETMKGVGRDVEKAGEAIQRSAD